MKLNRRVGAPCTFIGACATTVLLAAAFPALAQDTRAVSEHRCSIGSTDRFVHIELRDNGESGCGVIYEKRSEGEAPRAIWSANHDLNFCSEKLLATVEKLTAGGWACDTTGGEMMPGTTASTVAPADSADTSVRAASTAEADRVLPRKDPALASAASASTPGSAASVPPLSAPGTSTAMPSRERTNLPSASAATRPTAEPLPVKPSLALAQPQPKAPVASEFDDWIFRWDDDAKEIVFTVYSTTDGRKVETRRFSPASTGWPETRPSNMVLAQDAFAKQVLIVAWPDDRSQRITVLDPLLQAKPICQISTRSDRDSGWGYGVKDKALFLKGMEAKNGDPGNLVEFRQTCDYTR